MSFSQKVVSFILWHTLTNHIFWKMLTYNCRGKKRFTFFKKGKEKSDWKIIKILHSFIRLKLKISNIQPKCVHWIMYTLGNNFKANVKFFFYFFGSQLPTRQNLLSLPWHICLCSFSQQYFSICSPYPRHAERSEPPTLCHTPTMMRLASTDPIQNPS